MENEIRRRIIDLLKGHPEGLTILGIAEFVDVSRFTASKYVYGLIAEDIVNQRIIGPAKLCCLNSAFLELESMTKKEKKDVNMDYVEADDVEIVLKDATLKGVVR
jgi:hypothetical protein